MSKITLVVNYPGDRTDEHKFVDANVAMKWLRMNNGWTSFMLVGTHL
jgi:hypothetical protein